MKLATIMIVAVFITLVFSSAAAKPHNQNEGAVATWFKVIFQTLFDTVQSAMDTFNGWWAQAFSNQTRRISAETQSEAGPKETPEVHLQYHDAAPLIQDPLIIEPEHIHDLDVVGTMNIESPVLSSKKPDGKDGAPEEDISGTDTRTLVDLQDEALCSEEELNSTDQTTTGPFREWLAHTYCHLDSQFDGLFILKVIAVVAVCITSGCAFTWKVRSVLYRRRREHERKQIQCGLEQPLEQQNHDYSHPLTQVWRDSSKISNNVEKRHSRDHIFIREKENRQLHELTCIEQEEEQYTVLIQTLIRRKLARILANRMRLQSMTEVQRTVGRKIAALEDILKIKLKEIMVQDDGNCMFYALSHNLYGDVSRHAEIRREVSDWLALNGDYNMGGGFCLAFTEEVAWDVFVSSMRVDRAYGTVACLYAAAELYSLAIHLCQGCGEDTRIIPANYVMKQSCVNIYMTFCNNHYNPLMRDSKKSSTLPIPSTLPCDMFACAYCTRWSDVINPRCHRCDTLKGHNPSSSPPVPLSPCPCVPPSPPPPSSCPLLPPLSVGLEHSY